MQTNPRLAVPNVWYDLNSHVSSALAVANACIDYLPATQGPQERNCEMTGHLVCAMHDLLELCQKDVLQLEQDLLKMGRVEGYAQAMCEMQATLE